ncbi:MAG TPA: 8-oxo-dGTP diphosphatase [Spirochaetia bacterium]|nr:8-oxo-dGTP diphosphatase [Spirochaetia bacterium]
MTVSTFDWSHHSPVDRAVLCFIRDADRLLLIHKLRGLGKGKVIAPGGRIEKGESPLQAAIRETREEVGLTPVGLNRCGELAFVFTDGYSLDCTVFSANSYSGEPVETEEAKPFWCDIEQIPYAHMWEDDRLWLPLLLSGTDFCGYFIFDEDRMLDHRLLTGPAAALGAIDPANP